MLIGSWDTAIEKIVFFADGALIKRRPLYSG